ncbi:Kinesin-like protein KCA2 [Dichanthelium oligosanthes]|uniref:Kinesin-like protein KCA2 n=1 Tax=Dichanthelium oligosanthes TaxID=888268 RepID=A0A1E5VM81_9POAL|nr:Kinesin-like protein KCA2 [Dichanthelium oligosanthes]
MADTRGRWSWDVPGFEPPQPAASASAPTAMPRAPPTAMVLRPSAGAPRAPTGAVPVADRLDQLADSVQLAREDCLELRQEASDLLEYSNAKLGRVTRYLGFLADRTRKLDQAALETEARISPLIHEKKRLFNDLLTLKGNVKVFCRSRPLFEDEGPSVVEFPDDFTIRVNTGDESLTNPKKDYEFDRVYGPHIGQGELFHDVQPFVQSALDGYNISIFAYGQSRSGKTHTLEGSSHDRGLYLRSFEELFDLSNSDTTSTAHFNFYFTACELYNDQVRDLLSESSSTVPKVRMGVQESFVELVQEKVENPLEFSGALKAALQNRSVNSPKAMVSHLIITIHIHYRNYVTGEHLYSKLSLVDLPASECLLEEDARRDNVTDFLHVSKSLSALGDAFASLSAKKEPVLSGNSRITQILADSLGSAILGLILCFDAFLLLTLKFLFDELEAIHSNNGKEQNEMLRSSSKILLIVHVSPSASNLSRTLSTLSFSARARNAELSLGNRDTIKKWKDVANDSRKELHDKEKEVLGLRQEVLGLKHSLKEANDQCTLLFNEVQKAWRVSSTLQADLKLSHYWLQSENLMLAEKHKIEKEQNNQLRDQISHLLKVEQEQKLKMQERDLTIQSLQAKLKSIESQLNDALNASDARSTIGSESASVISSPKITESTADSSSVTKRLEEELAKRDALIEASSPSANKPANVQEREIGRTDSSKSLSPDVFASPVSQDKTGISGAIVKSNNELAKTTPAGEYLTSALMDFDPDQFEGFAAIADGANKLLMLVLAAVIKAGAAREHEILAEIRDAVFSFIRKMEPRRVMDTMLVSRVRILYTRSLIARSPELQSIKVSPVERFLEKSNTGRSRSSSRGSSPGRSPVYHHDHGSRTALVDEHVHGFKVNIKQEKKSKFSSIVLKLRGIEEETWRQHVTGGKLREITEEAKAFSIGNKALAALFVHTPAGELQRQIRAWLAENFDFLSVTGGDAAGGTTGQLELLSTAIMDGWMAGLGTAQPPTTDALGQLLSEYGKRVYTSQLQHLKDIAGTLATEEADDPAHVSKLRSALESVDHKRRKIMQQMRTDTALLSKEEGGSPIRNPPTAAEDARLASLISLDNILKQVKEVMRQSSTRPMRKSKRKALLESLDDLLAQMPSLLDIDHPCAQKQIMEARKVVESLEEDPDDPAPLSNALGESEVSQWNVLQFNTGTTAPFIIKCGANSSSELVIKADLRVQEPKGDEVIRVVPRPSILADLSFEEIKGIFEQLPEAISLLALARTADGTRARYSRLYRTLANKVSALKDIVAEMERGGVFKDVRSS